MNKKTVMIVDDHTIVREGLLNSFSLEEKYKVVAETNSGRSALRLATQDCPDCIIMDVSMPDLNGIETTREILSVNPDIKVIALSMHTEKAYVIGMLNAGASAYLLKSCSFKELLFAMDSVLSGDKYLCPGITHLVIDNSIHKQKVSIVSKLSQREKEVLQLISEGHKNKAIAQQLKISIKTVDVHRINLKKKLNIHSVAELTKFAIAEGITSVSYN